MQIADGHQCAIQQPEGLNPVKQKAEEPVEVIKERYEHQHHVGWHVSCSGRGK